VYSDRYCFGTNCYQSGLMDQVEWSLYSEMHTFFCGKLAIPLDAFIYLRTNPVSIFAMSMDGIDNDLFSLDSFNT
jgi:hypothetical protein